MPWGAWAGDIATMTDEPSPAFAISVQSDAYGGAQKVMGRSVAGENLLRGIARALAWLSKFGMVSIGPAG